MFVLIEVNFLTVIWNVEYSCLTFFFTSSGGQSYGGPMYMEDFPPRGGMMPDFPPGMRGGMDEPPMRRGYSDMGDFTSPGRYGNGMSGPDRGMMESDDMQHFPDDGPMRMGPDGFGPGQRNKGRGRPFPNDMPMNSSGDRFMGHGPKGPENNSLPATLLKYLVLFSFGYTVLVEAFHVFTLSAIWSN